MGRFLSGFRTKPGATLLYAIVLYSGILGGYLSPFWGITTFFGFCFLLVAANFKEIDIYPDSLVYLFFAIYSALSAVWAPDKWGAILFSQSLFAGALLYLVIRSGGGLIDDVLKLLLLCGTVNGILGLFQSINGTPEGLFYNRNPYAGFLTPLVFVAFYFLLVKRIRLMKLLAVFLLFSVLISESRGAIYSTFSGFFLLLAYLAKEKRWKDFKDVTLVLILGVAFFFVHTFFKRALALPERKIAEEGLQSLRWQVFKTYPALFLLSPLTGHGLNSFFYIKDKIRAPEMNILFEGQIHAHNIFFNIILELGIVGIMLLFLFLYLVIRKKESDSWFLVSLPLLFYLLPNLFEYNFPAPAFQVLFLSLSANCLKDERRPIYIPFFKRILIYGTLIFFIFFSVLPVTGTVLFQRGFNLVSRGKTKTGFELVLYSNKLSWICSHGPRSTADFLFETYLANERKGAQLLSLIEKEYIEALRLNKSVENYIALAKFYYGTGRKDEAESKLFEALKEYPHSMRLKMEMGKFYSATGNYERAIGILSEAESLYGEYAPSNIKRLEVLKALVCAYEEKGDLENAENTERKIKILEEFSR